MCAVFLGDLCVFVCVCAQEALNTRSWSRARAFKAAREAGDPGPATAETASGHLLQGERNHDQATCRLPIWMSTLCVLGIEAQPCCWVDLGTQSSSSLTSVKHLFSNSEHWDYSVIH